MQEIKNIKAVSHAINIIEFLYDVGKESSISEIAKSTGMFGSTIHRQLATLKEHGFIYQNPINSKYWLGLRFYAIGNMVKQNLPIINIIGAKADEVAKKYSQSIFIAMPDYSSDICAQQAIVFKSSHSPVRHRNEIAAGTILVSHGSATGKCMMAYYNENILKQYIKNPLVKLTERTITDWEALLAEFSTIRARGYALDSEEEEDGKTCVAIPILDSQKNVVASISLSGLTKSIFENPINSIVKDLYEIAADATDKI